MKHTKRPCQLACVATLFACAAVQAFNGTPGPACSTPGQVCTYLASDPFGGPGTVINGACAPNGFCADNGAACTTDDNCYSFCGGGLCGGAGAKCDSNIDFRHGQIQAACYTPFYTCSVPAGDGICLLNPSAAAKKRRRQLWTQAAILGEGCLARNHKTCSITGGYECVDTESHLEHCGGCSSDTGGVDCTQLRDVDAVRCEAGKCVIYSCASGSTLAKNRCTPEPHV